MLSKIKEDVKILLKDIAFTISPQLFHKFRLFNFERNILPKQFVKHMNQLTKANVVIDVGANIGLVSECLARRGSKVISFEPNSSAFSNLQIVAAKFENIDAHNVAVGTKNQMVKLYLHKDSTSTDNDLSQASSLLGNKPNVSTKFFEEIQEIDFAEFLHSLKTPIELLKIDIEGFEIDLINHLLDKNALDHVNKVYVETHERKFTQLIASTEKLKVRIKTEGYENKFFYDWH